MAKGSFLGRCGGNWWLRSPNESNSNNARNVNYDGNAGNNDNVGNCNNGVSPDLFRFVGGGGLKRGLGSEKQRNPSFPLREQWASGQYRLRPMGTVSGAPKKEMGYEEIFTYRHLFESYKKCLKGKRGKKEALNFSLDLSRNLMSLFHELRYKKYEVGGYHEFVILDPKRRVIQAIPFRDRIVQHCLVDYYLEETVGRSFILDNVACQQGKGTSLAHKRIKLFMREWLHKNGAGGYFVKADVHKYFESIDHEILKDKLSNRVADEEIREFLFGIIDSFHKETGKGLPMGNQTSQWFALLYLDGLDHFVKERLRARFYLRYMDDILLAVGTKKEAKGALMEISAILGSLRLMLNPKSGYMPFSKGVSFIGWRFYAGSNGRVVMELTKSAKDRIAKAISEKKADASRYLGLLRQGDCGVFMKKITIM